MVTISGTLSQQRTRKNKEYHTCTKNKRTINEIHKLRNNRKNIRNKNKGLRTGIQEQYQEWEQKEEDGKLKVRNKMRELRIRNKI